MVLLAKTSTHIHDVTWQDAEKLCQLGLDDSAEKPLMLLLVVLSLVAVVIAQQMSGAAMYELVCCIGK